MENLNYTFETDRLKLRPFNLNDSLFIIQLLNSPGWLEFIGDRNVKTEEQAKNYLIKGPILSYRQNGFGLSMVELKTDTIPIGMCGILKRESLENPDIGFAFLPEFTGQGYAYEITKATLTYASVNLNMPVVWAITVSANASSIKLLEKIGMRYKNKFSFPNEKEELLLYSN